MTSADNRAVILTENDIVDEFGDTVYRFCLSICRNTDTADDLFQDTYLSAFRQMNKLRDNGNALGFLLSTAVFLLKSARRKYARRTRIAPETGFDALSEVISNESSPESAIIRKEQIQLIRRIIGELPEKLRITVILHYTNELSVSEIAEILNIPEGTVKSRLFKARQLIEKGISNGN